MELSKISGQITEGAAARFATIKESDLGKIFDESGIDIYTALEENAMILFILNPLLYPETSPLIGNLIIIDSKKAVSNFYRNKKKRIFYILDEINVYASVPLLDLVNKSRSANITCVLATQSLSDLDYVSEQFKEQIIENCNNYIILRQNSSVNAENWSNVIGTRESLQATYQISGESGEAKSTDLGSLRKVREYLYHPDEIKLLQTGKAIYVSRDNMLHTKVNIHKPF
jgi:type IV secretory pathway TraG/TraD family ATPase VirD4